MKKNLFVIIMLCSLFSSPIASACTANFSWSQTANNVITFTDASTSVPASAVYYWDFGDGNYSYSQNPVHTYNVPGTYAVCLTLNDSLFFCSDMFCDSITVTGSVICNMSLTLASVNASCASCSDGSATVYATNGTPPYTYLWNTSQTTQTVTGLSVGTYVCCVTDANSCYLCDSVSVTVCQLSFTWAQTSNNVISFTNTSTGNFQPFWNFGDNNYSFVQNPVHTYSIPGTYVVCLIDSNSNCNGTFCDSVIVTGINCNNLALSITTVNASCSSCADGSAAASVSGGTPPFNYQWSPGQTTQAINNLVPGYYSCTITDANGCTAAASASVDSPSVGCSAYFTLTAATFPHTYNGINLATGTPPLSYVWSWGDSSYSYTAYPTHTYASAGFYNICLSIQDTTGCQDIYCDTFSLARMEHAQTMVTVTIYSSITGIKNAPEEITWTVYPNPFPEKAVIKFSRDIEDASFRLYDLYGRLLREKHGINGREIILPREKLLSGIYVYEVMEQEKRICTGKAIIY